MNKLKLSPIVTGSLLCATFYANISSTRADVRLYGTDVIALESVSTAPAVLMTRAFDGQRSYRASATARHEARPVKTAEEQRFDEYLKLHQSRSEAPAQEASQYAAVQ